MRFVTGQRAVVMGVGEFATFNPLPASAGRGRLGAWRAAVGAAWHQTLRERTEKAAPGARFEVTLQGRLLHRGWTLELQGRLDQLTPRENGWLLREIKTVSRPLPLAEDEIFRRYPEYFRQLAAYLRLTELDAAFAGAALAAELVLVDFSSGMIQTVPLTSNEAALRLEEQFDALLPYLEFHWSSRQRLAELPERAAFEVLRPGQAEAQSALAEIAGHAGTVLFEAPTGFGKTGLLWEYALARLREGHFQRIVYLTGKGTGQAPVTQQLRALLGAEPELRHIQLRSRREHAIATPRHTCDARGSCRADLADRWREAGIDPLSLFEDGTLTLEKSRRLGAETGVCPYEITRAALPYAEVWICDYNYVFAPANRGVLFNQAGFDPAHTLLVLDEAHNLPARAAEARSHSFTAADAMFAAQALRDEQARPALVRAAEQFFEFLEALRPAQKLDLTTTYALADFLEAIAAELQVAPLPEELSEAAADFLWAGADALGTLRDHTLELLPLVPAAGELRLACVDAAPAIAAALGEFGQSVLTSATFGPPEFFLAACALEAAGTRWISATAPWRDGAYDVAVDARVDTRLRSRERHYATTAEAIRLFAAGQPRPVAVFFPSYDYAEAVRVYLEALDAGLRVMAQPRGADLAAQTAFLDQALLTAHAIFFVLGGSFAEGIDRLGGEVERAMVVGPALPEPNAVNEAKRARIEETRGLDEAFRRTYLAPGILKVAQALGRLVRAPGQHARVLLHCRRFAESATQALLPPEYRGGPVLRRDRDLLEWLNK